MRGVGGVKLQRANDIRSGAHAWEMCVLLCRDLCLCRRDVNHALRQLGIAVGDFPAFAKCLLRDPQHDLPQRDAPAVRVGATGELIQTHAFAVLASIDHEEDVGRLQRFGLWIATPCLKDTFVDIFHMSLGIGALRVFGWVSEEPQTLQIAPSGNTSLRATSDRGEG